MRDVLNFGDETVLRFGDTFLLITRNGIERYYKNKKLISPVRVSYFGITKHISRIRSLKRDKPPTRKYEKQVVSLNQMATAINLQQCEFHGVKGFFIRSFPCYNCEEHISLKEGKMCALCNPDSPIEAKIQKGVAKIPIGIQMAVLVTCVLVLIRNFM
jgi:hypothetical protein